MLKAVFKSGIFENEVLREESDSKLRFETFYFVFPPSHLTPPPRFNIISAPSCYTQMPRQPSPRWWWSPPGLLSQHRLLLPLPIQHSCPPEIRKPQIFREENSFSLRLSGDIIVRNITDAHCDSARLFRSWVILSPFTEKASVLWCKPFLWNCCKVL